MIQSDVGPPRGILHPGLGAEKFNLTRKAPPPELEPWIEHFWMVDWDLRGCSPYVSQTLPHPSVHLVFEEGLSRVMGVVKGRFSTTLSEQGSVFAIKWRPGGFRGFVDFSIATLTDRKVPIEEVLGAEGTELAHSVLTERSTEKRIAILVEFFSSRRPGMDANLALIRQLMDLVLSDRSIVRVEDLVKRTSMNERAMQRIFQDYVGVSPKWVIKRARIHEVVERIAADPQISLSDLSAELGYFDQAHFIKDFKNLIGVAPMEYVGKAGPVR